ncbi:uncharacterized protein LOC6539972 [Drosophila yakuba]|uniref:uncharacterized protein LOC6539972 n=1 Tax=Drosophila yakuba TaxID=7245 RepID=UPI0019307CE2|nr:uncharacterized protein LOC6539972 [Drosophila yakuba]XP_039232463.1 uncharacterized protein LOC6539972 [Drosophila yakuba]XP_039232464.1 uncharacterized protein LOC6539972 [Drosophila yakuba]XP_039493425.1 uncharacterized protein LOC120452990 [Drosophila santomea]XP_039493426.1 uncharacterized protein LOC120452990 [Drosophila santomea]XP_039493427.1 uncharacterized protein LOC120452990 [Drosophila santomea]
MHQVLSYETAVRANSSREFREYVSKRTCASLVLTIAFFMLITGYLLGNFVAERKYHIRQMTKDGGRSVKLSSAEYASLQELQSYQKAKSQLLLAAQELDKLQQQDESEGYLATSLNTEIFNRYISCTQDIPPNTNIAASQFTEQLIDNTVARQRHCLMIIQRVIDNHLANSQL